MLATLRSGDGFRASPVVDTVRLVAKALAVLEGHDEAQAMVSEELGVRRLMGDKVGEAKMLLTSADIRWRMDEYDDALQFAEGAQAVILGEFARDRRLEAMILTTLSWIHLLGDEDVDKGNALAISCAATAGDICMAMGFRECAAEALHAKAAAQAASGTLERCLESADAALDLYLELRQRRRAAFEWLCMSRWALEQGRAAKALCHAEEALEVFQALGSSSEPLALAALFEAHLAEGRPGRAARPVKQALCRFEDSGEKACEAQTLRLLSRLHRACARDQQALEAAERALCIYRELGDEEGEGRQLEALASLHGAMGQHQKVLQLASKTPRLGLMRCLVEAHSALQHLGAAREVAEDMERLCETRGDDEGRAAALLLLGTLALREERLEEAARTAGVAQSLCQETQDLRGESQALRLLCDVYARREEHKAAVRAAEQARARLRELGDEAGETEALYLLAQHAVSLAIREGAQVENPRASRSCREALAKASKAAAVSVKQARGSQPHLLACALCVQSQVEMLSGRLQEALSASDEGVVLFRSLGDDASEASALLLSADALRATSRYAEAQEAAAEALRLFQGEAKGEARALELLAFLRARLTPAQAEAPARAQAQAQAEAQPEPHARPLGSQPEASVARRERGLVLDLSAGVEEAAVRAKVLEIAGRITGAEDGEIEADTPLMEAGLTSNSAILLRDELSQEMPGVSLPITLVFDYPSIAAMAELIVESSAKVSRQWHTRSLITTLADMEEWIAMQLRDVRDAARSGVTKRFLEFAQAWRAGELCFDGFLRCVVRDASASSALHSLDSSGLPMTVSLSNFLSRSFAHSFVAGARQRVFRFHLLVEHLAWCRAWIAKRTI